MRHRAAVVVVVALFAVPLTGGTSSAAHADGDDVERQGICSNGAWWRARAKPDDGRFEIEVEIDSNRSGQRWAWVLKHNGSVSDRGTSTTRHSGGSMKIERTAVDASGVDTLRLRAKHRGTVCVAQVSL